MSARGPHHQLRPDPLATAPDRFVPVPAEVIHPHVGAHALLTASPVRRASSAADLAPSALRPGATDALACPSRIRQPAVLPRRPHHQPARRPVVSAPYTPKPDSLAASVVHFFAGNPDEELTLDDISDKFDTGRNNIHTQLARAVDAGLLERGRNDDGEYTYTAGKGISVPKPGAKLTTTLAKSAALRGQARVDLTGLNLVVDKDVPLPEGPSAVRSKWDKVFELLTEVGYSIEIPIDVCLPLRTEAQKRAKRGAGHYRVLKTGDTTARIWRVPAPEGKPTHQPASKPARKSNGAAHV